MHTTTIVLFFSVSSPSQRQAAGGTCGAGELCGSFGRAVGAKRFQIIAKDLRLERHAVLQTATLSQLTRRRPPAGYNYQPPPPPPGYFLPPRSYYAPQRGYNW
jgi:hypothetical protein